MLLRAQSGSTMLVASDLDCNWKLDGNPQGMLKADGATSVSVSPGKHLVQAASVDGEDKWQSVVNVGQNQEVVEIKLKKIHQQRVAEMTWTDPETKLMWPKQDNGYGNNVNWVQARDYCASLTLAGYSDWRLPTVDELAGIYDKKQNVRVSVPGGIAVFHVKGNIKLSGFIWGNKLPDPGGAWAVYFNEPEAYQHVWSTDTDNTARSLCVRHSEE
jgi:hypothetical protein